MLNFVINSLLFFILVSCGKEAVTVGKKRENNPNTQTPTIIEDKIQYFDYSVNQAKVIKSDDGETLALMTYGPSQLPGSFQGSGIGNKAILGVGFVDSDNINLASFSFAFNVKTTSNNFYVNLLIDNNDDGVADNIVVSTHSLVNGENYSFNPLSFHVVCMPDCATWLNTTYSINDFPFAKIVNSTIIDNGMPKWARNMAMQGILIILGDSATVTSSTAVVTDMRLNK